MCKLTKDEPSAEQTSASSSSGSFVEDEDPAAKQKKKPQAPDLWRLLDPNEPWILVENGSLMGHFDYIPELFRVGPWHVASKCYLFVLCYWILWNMVECYTNPPPSTPSLYHDTDTWQWKCNLAGFLWTLYIAYGVTQSEIGWPAYTSYTLQSWTLIVVRYGLSTTVPFFPVLARYNEYLRFPMLLQMTVTFAIWNFLLFPALLSQMKTPAKRQGFIKFCFGFLVFQLHFVNLPLAAFSGIYGSPVRALTKVDLCVALGFSLQYVLFYLFVMDRLGAHFYFIFSPRTLLALVSWTTFMGCIYAGFSLWNGILESFLVDGGSESGTMASV